MTKTNRLRSSSVVSLTVAGLTMATGSGVYAFKTEENPTSPNLILINIDDMGWRDVGFMGSEYYETPNLDRFAGQGMIFTNAYASAANCTRNRACLVSGQWTPRHDIYTVGNSDLGKSKDRKLIPTPNNEYLSANNLIITEVLKNPDFWQ